MAWSASLLGEARPSSAALREELRRFGTYATVLHIAAHPDDENTQLIAYLARGRGYRMGYLSLTRGDGGQNEMGPEFGERLGVARTQELLAARRIDGGRQFFTRAIDFGYSKSVDETLNIWDRDQVVGDVVRVIRQFRPDVIITRFSPEPSGTHGHHTASAVVALEAFKLAGNPAAYPEQLKEGLTPWSPVRILHNRGRGDTAGGLIIEVGGQDAESGETFQKMAMRSRAQHRTQGFGMGPSGGGTWQESFHLLGGTPASKDVMDGIDTTWARIPGGSEMVPWIEEALSKFDLNNPSASVPALLKLKRHLASLPRDPVIADKQSQLDRLLAGCLGLTVECTSNTAEIVPGETLEIEIKASIASDAPVSWWGVTVPGLLVSQMNRPLKTGTTNEANLKVTVPTSAPLTQPYWLREEPAVGYFRVTEPEWIGLAENPPIFSVATEFEIDGQRLLLTTEVLAKAEQGGDLGRIDVISPVSLRFGSEVAIFPKAGKKTIEVEVTSARPKSVGAVHLEVPDGWSVTPSKLPFSIPSVGGVQKLPFTVEAPSTASSAKLTAVAAMGLQRYTNQRVAIRYPHIPGQLLQPPASLHALALDVVIRGKSVGYLPGAGDDTAAALAQLGYSVTQLKGTDLTVEKLQGFDAVVTGVRAFNERTDLEAHLPGLFAYVEGGGTVVAQYNRPNGLKAQPLAPYELSIEGGAPRQRVTDENSPVTFLEPLNEVLTTPNVIGHQDFLGWVQERGAYFPSHWDRSHFATVLAMNDRGEEPLTGGILIARHGKGYFVYTSLAFFRQLPAGVPGAYRLFANLVSLGK